ncbi:hypothetical protein PBRA_008870 [Plasmodiophora brassicae]|uniref:Uncharacterized protein n=1 Tax=Plasmodiophora brassicae TaxID=37360 RepID=A0A0G4J4T7_PLABS|nr:hypothetical protein PBRA_008870 [Plasmodiophora brassicae]
MASGSDDGSFKVWDLRAFKSGRAAGFFQWHDKPIAHGDPVAPDAGFRPGRHLDREEMALRPGAGGADLGGVDIPQLVFVHRSQTQLRICDSIHRSRPLSQRPSPTRGFNFFKPDNLDAP